MPIERAFLAESLSTQPTRLRARSKSVSPSRDSRAYAFEGGKSLLEVGAREHGEIFGCRSCKTARQNFICTIDVCSSVPRETFARSGASKRLPRGRISLSALSIAHSGRAGSIMWRKSGKKSANREAVPRRVPLRSERAESKIPWIRSNTGGERQFHLHRSRAFARLFERCKILEEKRAARARDSRDRRCTGSIAPRLVERKSAKKFAGRDRSRPAIRGRDSLFPAVEAATGPEILGF